MFDLEVLLLRITMGAGPSEPWVRTGGLGARWGEGIDPLSANPISNNLEKLCPPPKIEKPLGLWSSP